MTRHNKQIYTERRKKVSNLYLKGYGQVAIGDMLGICQAQVHKDLVAVRKQWESEAVNDIKELTLIELAKIDKLEQTYHAAWLKSCTDYKEKALKEKTYGSKKKKGLTETEKSIKENIAMGNPAFLKGIESCIQMRCNILGIKSPEQSEVKFVDKFSQLGDDDLDKEIRKFDKI